ncbi:G protein-coupled receptor kinase 6 [Cichlidogyrus casuarinus]|uniref:G protein-coupled receptor kinase n=1 Tax=Cichlidogyrus casuarinus TaxID=1844966 RepID=A0ABD2Q6P1_9PLAT
MMELENIVANTIYIQAKESGYNKDKGRSKKWRELLAFPHISECSYLNESINCTYGYIVEKQPIGKRLMWQFCRLDSTFAPLVELADEIEDFSVSRFEDRPVKAQAIAEKFLKYESPDFINKLPLKETKRILDQLSDSNVATDSSLNHLFENTYSAITVILKEEAFVHFLNSIYYSRYLQWKYLEKRSVTKHTFRMYRVLGKGGFGEVCACQVRATGKLYACKKLDKKRMKKRHGEVMAITEKLILQKVNSPFVVSLAYAFETKDSLCLVLTIMNGGDLRFHIHSLTRGTGFPEHRARFYAAEILLGLEHLHSLNIVYRDLKPCNILIDDQGHVRISDLGLATVIETGKTVKGRVGTLGYMAPEVLKNERYTFSPDWFGYGCIVYEMVMGLAPFRRRRNERIKREDFDRRVCEEPEEYDSKFSEHAKSLCQALLAKKVDKRLGCNGSGAKAVKEHAWFDRVNWDRYEARLEEPPFRPDLHAVYAKDVLDIEQFSTVRGVKITEEDKVFYEKLCTGAVSIPWQDEMIETDCFDDLNLFYDAEGRLVENLDPAKPPQTGSTSRSWACLSCGLFRKKRSSEQETKQQMSSQEYLQASSTMADPETQQISRDSPQQNGPSRNTKNNIVSEDVHENMVVQEERPSIDPADEVARCAKLLTDPHALKLATTQKKRRRKSNRLKLCT